MPPHGKILKKGPELKSCNISPHKATSVIHIFVLMITHSILNKGVLVITRSTQSRELMAASLYRDDREANIFAKYGATKCLEMFSKYYNDPSDEFNDIPCRYTN
jgi:hypothetical protein